MRNSIFALSMVLGGAVIGCGGDNNNNLHLGDMAMHVTPMHDLSVPPSGCNGLLVCYHKCATATDVTACESTCDDNSTAMAQTLSMALNTCLENACFKMNDADSGMPYCDCLDANGKEVSCTSSAAVGLNQNTTCTNCLTDAENTGGACDAQTTACANDKP